MKEEYFMNVSSPFVRYITVVVISCGRHNLKKCFEFVWWYELQEGQTGPLLDYKFPYGQRPLTRRWKWLSSLWLMGNAQNISFVILLWSLYLLCSLHLLSFYGHHDNLTLIESIDIPCILLLNFTSSWPDNMAIN